MRRATSGRSHRAMSMTWSVERRWRKLRADVLAEEAWCVCGAPATEAGHVISRAAGGPDARWNMVGQCHECHVAQLDRDRDRQAAGQVVKIM